jgi:uncharacterized membrane protein
MAPGKRAPLRTGDAGRRVAVSMLVGVVAGVPLSFVTVSAAAILLGWDTTAVVLLIWIWAVVGRLDSDQTADRANREDPSVQVAGILVVCAGTAMLVGVGYALLKAGHSTGGMKAYLITVGVSSVLLSWAVVHTVFTLSYARQYYLKDAGGIDFNEKESPTYLDFAYLAFTIGMTFQVSDTNITSKAIRRIALRHALLSYLFGAVIIGLVINVVASLL